jgi:outer membrane protein TolC
MSKQHTENWKMKRQYRRFIHQKISLKVFLNIGLLMPLLFFALMYNISYAADKNQLLTLDEAISLAIKNQPSLTAGRFTVKANEARIGEALSAYYPQLSASASYSKTSPAAASIRSSGSSLSGISTSSTSNSYDAYGTSTSLSQLIYDFGKTSTQVKINRFNTESAQLDLTYTQDNVVLNVKVAYYNVIQALRNEDVVRKSIEQYEQHLQQAQGFFDAGTKAKFEVTKAEVDLGNARVNLINAENQVRQAYVALKNAIGIPNAPDYTLDNSMFYAKFDLPFEEALSKAYTQRPDLLSVIQKREATRESVNLVKKSYYPTLSGSANYQYTGTDFPIREGWTYGMNLSIPLFNGFITRHQIAEAQANFGVISANEQTLRLNIFSEVQQAYLSLRAAGEKIGASELLVRQAKENVELATGRYEAGVGSPLEVTDAIAALGNTGAITDYKNAQATIEKAIGEKK